MPRYNYPDRYPRLNKALSLLGFLIFAGLFIAGCIFIPSMWPALTVIGSIIFSIGTTTLGVVLGALIGMAGGSRQDSVSTGLGMVAIGVLGAGIGLVAGIVTLCLIPPLPFLVITLAAAGLAITSIGTAIFKGFCDFVGSSIIKNSNSLKDDSENDHSPSLSPSSTARTHVSFSASTRHLSASKQEEDSLESAVPFTIINSSALASSAIIERQHRSPIISPTSSSTRQPSYSMTDLQRDMLHQPENHSPVYLADQPGLVEEKRDSAVKRKVS